jgi:DNA-binding NtrC family response regulator/tetratricopeptide (TPR) repeat protein
VARPLVALAEADALLAWQRYRDAIGVTTQALARRPGDRDLAARLRGARGTALWATGRLEAGLGELRRAWREARAPQTVARVHESFGVVAWRELDGEQAWRHLERAREIHESCRSPLGVVRVLESETGVLHVAGRLDDALDLVGRRLEASAALGRADSEALARCDRGILLSELGRFAEAARELEQAAALLDALGDPRGLTRVGVARAAVALLRGELEQARAALDRAREAHATDGACPRSRGEAQLVASDLALATGDAAGAERAALDALTSFGLVRDRSGQARSRTRRSHALLALGQPLEAAREAGRAAEAAAARPELEAAAQLARGRALLQARPQEAAAAFERAASLCARRPGLAQAARLGRALVAGAPPEAPDVRRALDALEAWGDRLLLFHCLAAVRDVHPPRSAQGCATTPGPQGRSAAAGPEAAAARACEPSERRAGRVRAPGHVVEPWPGFVDAVEALMGEGEWRTRWARAVAAVGRHLGARRVSLVSEPSLQWSPDCGDAAPLPPRDLARELAARGGPSLWLLGEHAELRDHPSRALHGIGLCAVAPVAGTAALCVDYAEGRAPDGGELGAAIELARLLALHLPEPQAPAVEGGDRPLGFPGIVGRCAAMRALFEGMEQAAGSDHAVHIFGETGTGKERVARGIHERSGRRGAFVAVNASTLPDDLFESELFGHVRGAFTGAVRDRVGHVEAASGGTLFLDEVTDLSPRGQAKLLRFLQEREYQRLGETTLRKADVRVLTASNARLEERVAAGLFRHDLMYRLNVLALSLPPLRERGDDVLLLARHFLRERARAGEPKLPPDFARVLMRHRWPGNIRELESEMQRVAMRARGGPLRVEHLSPELTSAPPAPARATLRELLLEHERRHVAETLARHGGRRGPAACELGVTRQALAAKMRRLGILAGAAS